MTPRLHSLHLEITTRCTAHCPICPRDTLDRRDRDMPVEEVVRLAKQARDMGAKEIHPHLFGEPTMHPEYLRLLAELRRHCPNLAVVQYTNGWGLGKPEIRKAILANVDRLVVSIDGVAGPAMQKTRPGLDPLAIAAGVTRLHQERSGKTPRIEARMTVRPGQVTTAEDYREYWGPWVDGFSFAPLQDFHGYVNADCKRRGAEPCDRIFKSLVVLVTGQVALCCDDYAGEVVLGDASSDALAAIWGGERMREIRESHLAGKSALIPICSRCTWLGKIDACDPIVNDSDPATGTGETTMRVDFGTLRARVEKEVGNFVGIRVAPLVDQMQGKRFKHILDIGTMHGFSAAILAHYAHRVTTIDIVDRPLADKVLLACKVKERVRRVVVRSNDEKERFVARTWFDMAFIDGDHTRYGVLFDFAITRRCGCVLFHDYPVAPPPLHGDKVYLMHRYPANEKWNDGPGFLLDCIVPTGRIVRSDGYAWWYADGRPSDA